SKSNLTAKATKDFTKARRRAPLTWPSGLRPRRFVSSRPVYGRQRNVEQSKVDRELSAVVYDVIERHRANDGHARQLEEDLLAAPQPPPLLHALVRLILQELDGVGDVPVKLLK